MRVSVEYYDGEPREALKLYEEEWGIISCPEKRTGAPSPVKLRQTYSRDAFRRRTKPKYRKR